MVAAASGAVGALVGQIAQDQGRARGRHRGRAEQVRLRQGRTRLRRLPRSSRARPRRAAQGRVSERDRRLFRECRRRGVRGGVSAAQSVRARAGLRPDLAIQCGVAARGHAERAAGHARDADQAAQLSAASSSAISPRATPIFFATWRRGSRRAASSIARTWSRDWSRRRRRFIGLLRGENFGKRLVRVAP